MLTKYLLNIHTHNDIEMMKQYFPDNETIGGETTLHTFYKCDLNPSKYSPFDIKESIILFIVDLSCYQYPYHRTILNTNTNDQINEMQHTVNAYMQEILNALT